MRLLFEHSVQDAVLRIVQLLTGAIENAGVENAVVSPMD